MSEAVPLRALVVSAWAPWRMSDGASLVLHHHLRHLAAEHEISVLAPEQPQPIRSSDDLMLPENVSLRLFAGTSPRWLDYAARRVRSARSGEPAHTYWVERRALVEAFLQEMRERTPDVLHLHGWGTAQFVRMAADIPTLHVPIDAWSLGRANRLFPAWRRAIEKRQLSKIRAYERRYYPQCGAVVVVAPADAGHIKRIAPTARVEVVPNGVEPGPEPGPPTEEPVIGFHGAYETAANRDAALALVREVLPRVRDHQPEARALVIGRNPGREIRRHASEQVVVTGWVDDVRTWLQKIAVYTAPVVSGTGLKNKVLEAMVAGLPVVGTSRALEGIGEGDGVFLADTPAAIADRTLSLLADSQARQKVGRLARARALRDFSWERSAGGIGRLWRELVDSSVIRSGRNAAS